LIVGGLVACLAAARAALHVHVDLPSAPAPRHPVLFFNPRSGGGKAERFALAKEAATRGIEPIELKAGDDLETLVRAAVARGADGLAMAGGDGSQAVVAAVAAECGLPYACVPAGTRNHFALDLGVDRDDVVGALDAFVDGGERRVDLAEVNGRVFVNNVSLGLYAQAVQRAGYRDAKIRTLLDTAPDVLGPGGDPPDMRWQGPGGQEHRGGAAVLVSNNRCRLGRAVGSGTRPRIDDGLLGITVVGAPTGRGEDGSSSQRPWREWSAPTFEVDAERPVAAGIDGETVVLDPPLHFRIRPGVLQVRVARQHPGASPSALIPEGMWAGVAELARIALGREQTPAGSPPSHATPGR
jgi:diacylglycerol kinase family enzyme